MNPVIASARNDFKCRREFGEYLASLGASLGLPSSIHG